jgi:hypothetical protein
MEDARWKSWPEVLLPAICGDHLHELLPAATMLQAGEIPILPVHVILQKICSFYILEFSFS